MRGGLGGGHDPRPPKPKSQKDPLSKTLTPLTLIPVSRHSVICSLPFMSTCWLIRGRDLSNPIGGRRWAAEEDTLSSSKLLEAVEVPSPPDAADILSCPK